MVRSISRFQKEECGAVTVDYVVLTAAIVGLATSFFFAIETQTKALNESTAASLTDYANQ